MFLEVNTPGKVMLVGEYVALRGAPVLAVAVGPGMKVTAQKTDGTRWVVSSDLWQCERYLSLDDQAPDHAGEPLLACIWEGAQLANLKGGLLKVDSAIRVEDGMGSSSALRLAVASVFSKFANNSFNPLEKALEWQKKSQKHASGYDIVTQYYGGCLKMTGLNNAKTWPGEPKSLDLQKISKNLELWCGGSGAPTGPVMKDTMAWLDKGSDRWSLLEKASEDLVAAFENLSSGGAWKDCYKRCGEQRSCFEGSPHYPQKLSDALSECSGLDLEWSFKFTGAGGEDAILLLGDANRLVSVGAKLLSLGWNKTEKSFSENGTRIIEGK